MNFRIFDDHETLSAAAARTVRQCARSLVGVSGGSTPARTYELLAESLPGEVTWFLVDERDVPPGHERSNSSMIERTLFARGVPSEQWLRFPTELGDAAMAARDFEREWLARRLPSADLVILGCGEDGHTASLFPGTSALAVDDRLATEVWVPSQDEWRMTVTKSVLRAAALRIVLASGESKRAVLRELRDGAELPIGEVTRGVETWWFVDRAAMG